MARVSGSHVTIRWNDWQPRSLVVRVRHTVFPIDFQATGRVVPADDAPRNRYRLDLAPFPGSSPGACPIA